MRRLANVINGELDLVETFGTSTRRGPDEDRVNTPSEHLLTAAPDSPTKGTPLSIEGLHVVILSGGISHERDVSLRSGRRVADALSRAGADVTIREPDASLLGFLEEAKPDVVWPLLHGSSGENGALYSLLRAGRFPTSVPARPPPGSRGTRPPRRHSPSAPAFRHLRRSCSRTAPSASSEPRPSCGSSREASSCPLS